MHVSLRINGPVLSSMGICLHESTFVSNSASLVATYVFIFFICMYEDNVRLILSSVI